MNNVNTLISVSLLGLSIAGCTDGIKVKKENVPTSDREAAQHGEAGKYDSTRESVFGDGGLTFFNSNKSSGGDGGGVLGVNSYLWRAALDSISFMPVTSADPFGGVIITDWHASPDSPDERFKLNIYILGRALRADGVRVSVFRQVLQNQVWRDASVETGVARKIEDAFLTRARQLRNKTLGQN